MAEKKQEWFKPSVIAKQNMITNSKGLGDYGYVVRLIKRGHLKARAWTSTSDGKKYWLVHIDEINRFNKEGITNFDAPKLH